MLLNQNNNALNENIVNEMDREVQEVNTKSAIKVLGRTGRFSQIKQNASGSQ